MTGENSGRISTKTFYAALLKQTEKMGEMEVRIIDRISEGITSQQEYRIQTDARLAAGSVHLEHLDDDIKSLKLWDRGLGIVSIIGSTIASIIGIEK